MTERKIKIIKNYYDEWDIYNKSYITLKSGLTVLVGCNGAGKTTLLNQISSYLDKNHIDYIEYNNISDGGSHAMESMMFYGDTDGFARAVMSSEGERIHQNIGNLARKIGAKTKKIKEGDDFFVLIDAMDSGLSIDHIVDIKDFLKDVLIPDYIKRLGGDIYIVTVANEYEMANGERCFDVQECKYVTFKDYEDYKKFILESRKKKDKKMDDYYDERDKSSDNDGEEDDE